MSKEASLDVAIQASERASLWHERMANIAHHQCSHGLYVRHMLQAVMWKRICNSAMMAQLEVIRGERILTEAEAERLEAENEEIRAMLNPN